jgi:hypothetical protein
MTAQSTFRCDNIEQFVLHDLRAPPFSCRLTSSSGAVAGALLEQQEECRREGLYELPLLGGMAGSAATPTAPSTPAPLQQPASGSPATGGSGGGARGASRASAVPDDQRLRDEVPPPCESKVSQMREQAQCCDLLFAALQLVCFKMP